MSKSHWVMDFETLNNCFIAVFQHHKETIERVFVVHALRNDIVELVQFLEENVKNKEWHISFNGLAFDAQITMMILKQKKKLVTLSGEEIATLVYAKAQEVISKSNNGDFQEYSEKDITIKQVDIFKLNHWDNPAKRSSLKWIQFSMDWDNIQEMPIHHSKLIKTLNEIEMIIGYCKNDVNSTKRIMELSKDQINLRANLTAEYGISLYSASEPRISKELFMHFLSEKTGIAKYELRQLRTRRTAIHVKDLIVPYTKFNTRLFQDLLDNFKMVIIDPNVTKNGFKYSLSYKGVKTDFGLGGVHGAIKAGVYKSTEDTIIMTSDVISFYPNLAIRNGWSPAHLPQEDFCELYEWFFEERKKIPKKDPRNYVYKIILNSTYGLSNDKNSFLYDPQFTMQITLNGQLTLMMLYEMLAEAIPDCQPLMQNTDGLEMIIPKEYKEKYLAICAEWEKITNLQLEHDEYSKMIIGDVNNYIAVNKAGKYKCKGRFEFEELALHKNKSSLIIPKAVFNYFVLDVRPEDTLAANKNIIDYCIGVKIKGDWEFHQVCMKKGVMTDTVLQKTLRYYVSDKGCKIIKVNKTDKREIQVEAGKWLQEDLSNLTIKPWSHYHVNESYYLEKIYKEINNICPPEIKQLTIF
jgi:hypothetical protein